MNDAHGVSGSGASPRAGRRRGGAGRARRSDPPSRAVHFAFMADTPGRAGRPGRDRVGEQALRHYLISSCSVCGAYIVQVAGTRLFSRDASSSYVCYLNARSIGCLGRPLLAAAATGQPSVGVLRVSGSLSWDARFLILVGSGAS